MTSWAFIRFSAAEVAAGLIARMMRDLLPLALELHRQDDVGVFSSDLGSDGKRVYFSPGAVKAFAAAIAKLPSELCASPDPQALSLLYGARECLSTPAGPRSDVEPPRVLRVDELVE